MLHQTNALIEWPEAFVALISVAVSVMIVVFARYIPSLTGGQRSLGAVQAMHTKPTPRLGGLAIFAALFASLPLAPPAITDRYTLFIAAASFLFVVGLAEDLGLGISPRKRLMAAAISSVLVMSLLDVWLPRADVPLLDDWMDHWAVAVPLTLLVTLGVANGFNLIDGVNGLAALTAIVAAVALALIADAAGYTVMVHLSMMLAAAILGFMVLNYPFGFIFLGDAGAYTLGFVLSWFAISILNKVPDASAWAMLLVVFWPVADTVLAIWRRSRSRRPAMAPDRLHFHQLVMRALEIHFLGRGRRQIANPLTTLILSPMVAAPPMVGVLFWDQPVLAFLSVLFFAALFGVTYNLAKPALDILSRTVGAAMSRKKRS
jgi:UDP-N-acetylmuramyl pentapeptide phosphotransferase/UDP-N-acetylglucosamine-1-phosphate transferase